MEAGGIERLWRDPDIRAALAMCAGGGMGGIRFLFEVRPDIFPQGFLTQKELALWGMYYQDAERRRKKPNG